MMKTVFSSLAVAAVLLLAPAPSQAACNVNGVIVNVDIQDDRRGSVRHVVRIRKSALDSTYFFGRTLDDNLAEAALQAMSNKNFVRLQGTAADCPTTGAARDMGNIILLWTN